jgi:DNA topoisomerase IA
VDSTYTWDTEDNLEPGLTTSEICELGQTLGKGNRNEISEVLKELYTRGVIRFFRTEDPNLPTESYAALNKFAEKYSIPLEPQKREWGDTKGNGCLHPTDWNLTPEKLATALGNTKTDALLGWVYENIYRRALNTQRVGPKTKNRRIFLEGPLPLTPTTISKITHIPKDNPIQSHMKVTLGCFEKNPEKDIEESQIFQAVGQRLVQHKTQPPQTLSEEELRRQITEFGIGGQDRTDFLLKELGTLGLISQPFDETGTSRIELTSQGEKIAKILHEDFGQFLHINYHRSIQKQMTAIEDGRQEGQTLLETWWSTVQEACEESSNTLWEDDSGGKTKKAPEVVEETFELEALA